MEQSWHPQNGMQFCGTNQFYGDAASHEEWLELNRERIAIAAYYKAQSRGFAPNHEVDDWLEAEKEIWVRLMWSV
jgi:hypothetical protein